MKSAPKLTPSSIKIAKVSSSLLPLFVVGSANATIIHISDDVITTLGKEPVYHGPTVDVPWDIDQNGSTEAHLGIRNNGDGSNRLTISIYQDAGTPQWVVTGSTDLINLATSQIVNAGQAFYNSASHNLLSRVGTVITSAVGFTSGVSAYIGFSFKPAATTLYGWARITLTEGPGGGNVTIHEWAYDDSGAGIQVGAVPEPATSVAALGLLALGAAGLRRWRKQKQAV